MRARGILAMGLLALAASGAAGCSTYHYYDIDVQMSTSGTGMFAPADEISRIQILVMTVTGADQGQRQFGLGNGIPIPATGHLGVVEYSTFVDSGTLNFTIDAYDADNPQAACKVGEGTMSMSATGNTTNTGMLTVDRLSTATFCCSMPSGC